MKEAEIHLCFKRLKDVSNVESVALHPGLIRTNMVDAIENKTLRRLIKVIGWICGKNGSQGAQTSLHCVLTKDKIGGKYLSDCREEKRFVSPLVGNVRIEEKLFEETKALLRIKLDMS